MMISISIPSFKATTCRALIVLGLIGISAMPAAASVTYSYTGQNFNLLNTSLTLNSPYQPNPSFSYANTDRLTFTFTLASALAANSSTDLNLVPMNWTASDGKYTFGGNGPVNLFSLDTYGSGSPVLVGNAGFATDGLGDIIGWNFSVFNGAHASMAYSVSTSFLVGESLGFAQVVDYAYARPGTTGNTNDPIAWVGTSTRGSWLVTDNTPPSNSVPLPSTLSLILAGLALLARSRRALPALAITIATQAAVAQSPSSVSFGGKAIAIDMTSCSPENSSNGKNRAIAAINSASASSATVQFATLAPATGTYTTVANEEGLGSGKVLLAAGGSAFSGVFLAKEGQTIKVTNSAGRYQAVFIDLLVADIQTKVLSPRKLSGDIACQ